VGLIKPATKADENQYLTLSAQAAKDLGIAHAVVANLEGLYELEGLSPSEVRLADADWLDTLADFLRDPMTSVVLVMLGVTCLILELKMPGVTFPGVVAAICFVLFFWSHSQLNGQITMLALLLFVLGLVLIGLEIFVLPGFGVAGLSGILLVVGSLGLVAYGHWPRTNEEWIGFSHKLGPFGLGILGSLAAALALVRYLPHLPFANRLLLHPQIDENEAGGESAVNPYPELSGLLGAIGVAATPLRPAGKVQFGDDFVDVVADGGYVQPGTRVQVIEIEGNRVVVKEV
jgi:membrane-bound ClpP family serine protease